MPEDHAKRLYDLIFAEDSPGQEFTRITRRNSRWDYAYIVLAVFGFGMSIAGLFMMATAR